MVQSFTSRMLSLTATSAFGLGRRRWSYPRQCYLHCLHTLHTHTSLTALCPGLPGWAGTRKVKPVWILLKQETVSGSGISWAICKSAPCSRQITTPAPYHSVFYRVDALPAAQPTASKHWSHCIPFIMPYFDVDCAILDCLVCLRVSIPHICQTRACILPVPLLWCFPHSSMTMLLLLMLGCGRWERCTKGASLSSDAACCYIMLDTYYAPALGGHLGIAWSVCLSVSLSHGTAA